MEKKKFATTIMRKWLIEKEKDARANGGYFTEYKNETPHWNKRLKGLSTPCIGVYLVGRESLYFDVIGICSITISLVDEKYREAVNGPLVWAVKCYKKEWKNQIKK